MDLRVNTLANAWPQLATAAALAEAAAGAGPMPDQPTAELAERLSTPAHHGLPTEAHGSAGAAAPTAGPAAAQRMPEAGPGAVAEATPSAWAATAPSAFSELAAAPLTPVWVQALQAPPLQHQHWPGPALQPEERQRQRQARAFDERDEAHEHTEHDSLGADDDAGDEALPIATPPPRPHVPHPLQHQLPPPLQAELQRRRGVLLWAPAARGQRGVQAWWLGFDSHARATCRRLGARGQGPREAAWQWWLLKRSGDDGCGTLPQVRPAAGSSVALALRVCGSTLPAPLQGPDAAWLDLTDAARLWRELGQQWSWLTAWSPSPLGWMR